jgi:outer membrane protein assembly factor BamB
MKYLFLTFSPEKYVRTPGKCAAEGYFPNGRQLLTPTFFFKRRNNSNYVLVKNNLMHFLQAWSPLLGLFALIFLMSCSDKKTEVVWNLNLPRLGSESSIRTRDLNGDGILDIVLGAGENEYVATGQGILAIDGHTGQLIWQQAAKDLVFGSATFLDVTGDGVDDVFIGGRSCILQGLDGKTGDTLWTYHPERYADDPVLSLARNNFYNSVLVPDQNGDGYQDLLIQNGGNPKIGPGVWEGRVTGILLIIDPRSGSIIAGDTMPDGMESYMSPLAFRQKDDEEFSIIFGSGGETFGGNLYLAKLSDLRNQQLSRAQILASEEGHGFIAPPVLADITDDGYLDIIAISHASTAFAIDGRSMQTIWQTKVPGTECSNSFAVGYFTEDNVPDFFTFVSKGEWPNNTGSLQILLDGKDGSIAYQNTLGCTGFSSPVACDLNGDGRSEAIFSINEFDCSAGFSGDIGNITNKLMAIDFATGREYPIDQKEKFKNIFTTPWIGDLDGDGYLDILHCQYYHSTPYITAFLGFEMKRISTHIKLRGAVPWGGYMGTRGDGIFYGRDQ